MSLHSQLCVGLMVVLEVVALACGVVGWRSPSGKAGVAISVVALTLVGFAVMLVLPVYFESAGKRPDAPSDTPPPRTAHTPWPSERP